MNVASADKVSIMRHKPGLGAAKRELVPICPVFPRIPVSPVLADGAAPNVKPAADVVLAADDVNKPELRLNPPCPDAEHDGTLPNWNPPDWLVLAAFVCRPNAGNAAVDCVLDVCGWTTRAGVPNKEPVVAVCAPAGMKPDNCGAAADEVVAVVAEEKLNNPPPDAAAPNNDAIHTDMCME